VRPSILLFQSRELHSIKDIMSRIIEGSLEILRPVGGAAMMLNDEDASDDEDDASFAETDKASGSEDEDESVIAERGERATSTHEEKWQYKVQLLRKYRKQHGHCQVPDNYKIDGVKLGRWLQKQRGAYKKHCNGMPSWITQERIDQLGAIGVDWNPKEAQWHQSWSFCNSIKSSMDIAEFPEAMKSME